VSAGPPPVPGGRSDDERERARRERLARRAGSASPPPRTPRTPRAPRAVRVNRRGRIVLGLLAVLVVALGWFLFSLFQPFHGDGSGPNVTLTIPRSSGVGEIAELLEEKGVVSSAFFFEARATIGGKRGDLKPGRYTLPHDMSYSAALDKLSDGPGAEVVTVVVPEGRSRREIAASLKDAALEGDYLAATKRSAALNPRRYGASGARDLEGFLFPATYQLRSGSKITQLVTKQLQAFKQRFAEVDLRRAKRKNLTPYDVLIIASLVERETAVSRERKLIASVIYNRLRAGTPLGIDATTRFQFDKWRGALTNEELASPSPYNTRTHRGLPPGPIGNPGVASIEAAAAPASTGYMFYVANPCRPGTHTFTKTLDEFNAAVAKYNAARAKAGGNAPKGC
jgi:UPF0755 protein